MSTRHLLPVFACLLALALPLPAQFQKADLIGQGPGRIKIGAVENFCDFLQGKLKLPQKQNGVQSFQGGIVIEPVAGLRHLAGPQKPDGIIVVQRPDTDTG